MILQLKRITPTFFILTVKKNRNLIFVLLISDNGGSTSKILKLLGEPTIGEIRSRIFMLNEETLIQNISYHLFKVNSKARIEWDDFVEGVHLFWDHVLLSVKEKGRTFLILTQSKLLKK